jgi:hypothetical protein
MSQRAETPRLDAARIDARAWVAARGFVLCVAAVTLTALLFLLHQLMAWPPHEDETLALFVGRDTLGGLVTQVTRERGGAPLHFLLAWLVAHAGLGLGTLRLASASFAVASLPLVAVLGRRLISPTVGVIAAALVAGSWALLFSGVYARMYALFLFTFLLSLLALLRALDGERWTWWAAWAAALLACLATHPYGALVIGGEVVFVAVQHRARWRAAGVALAVVVTIGTPFWLSDLVLAGRFDVGVGGGGARLGGPWTIVDYLWRTAGDFSAGWRPVRAIVLCLALLGVLTCRRETRRLALALLSVPTAAFLAARLGGSTSPESRHLIFLLPLLAILTAAGTVRATGRAPVLVPLLLAGLLVAEVSWAWHRTAPLFEWEPDARQAARAEAEHYLATTSRPDDVLFGYEPLYLGAWERNHHFPVLAIPRADPGLALHKLGGADGTLGRGTWVLDASERNNRKPRLEIENHDPGPPRRFETRAFGPFLVVRTAAPVRSTDAFLAAAGRVQLLGRSLGIGDADINLLTVERAARALRGYPSSAWLRSSHSR